MEQAQQKGDDRKMGRPVAARAAWYGADGTACRTNCRVTDAGGAGIE